MDLVSYNEALARAKAAMEKKTDFEKDHDVRSFADMVDPGQGQSLEEIHARLDAIGGRLEELSGNIRDESRQHDALAEKLESWEEDQEKLAAKEEELFVGKHEYKNGTAAYRFFKVLQFGNGRGYEQFPYRCQYQYHGG